MPKYSVIIRTYNEKDELKKSIKSVQEQTYNNWELVVVDDGSREETARIADECARDDSRIRVIHQDNQGGLGAFRKGIKEAKGEFLAFLDAGDVYEPSFLEEADIVFSRDNTEIDMILFGLREIFPDHDEIFSLMEEEGSLKPRELLHEMERTISFFGLALRITRREAFSYTKEEEEFYDLVGKSGNYGDDLYLLTPLFRKCRRVFVSNKPLYGYVYNENSLSHHFPSYTWEDAWNRNRLLGFTYHIISECGWMDEEMEGLVRKHAITLLAPCAKWIVRHNIRDKKRQLLFKKDTFFRKVVVSKGFGKNASNEWKSRFALKSFFLMVLFS